MNLIKETEEEVDLDMSTYYFLTWNPNNKKVATDEDYQLKWNTMIVKYISKINRCSDHYCFIPEISVMGRLHVHGWFKLTDKIKWHHSVRPMLMRNGRLKVDRMNSKNGFYYCKKDLEDTLCIIDKYVVIVKDNLVEICKDIYDSVLMNRNEEERKSINIMDFTEVIDFDNDYDCYGDLEFRII